MTKFLAALMDALLWGLTIILPSWKRLTVRARLHDKLQTFEDVKIGDKSLKIFITDRAKRPILVITSLSPGRRNSNRFLSSFLP
jgi:hypothetical protein